jgi:divalent metal cation (Fe/Co/Zn/Cd) transporter
MKKAYRLEYLTIAWNSFEALVAIVAGGAAGSIALVAFGLDSVIEVFAPPLSYASSATTMGQRNTRMLRNRSFESSP